MDPRTHRSLESTWQPPSVKLWVSAVAQVVTFPTVEVPVPTLYWESQRSVRMTMLNRTRLENLPRSVATVVFRGWKNSHWLRHLSDFWLVNTSLCLPFFSFTEKPSVEAVKAIGNGALAGIVIAVILVVLIAIDLFCCFFNSCGLFFCCKQLLCKEKGATKASYAVKDATAMEKKKLAAENSNV